MIAQEAGAFVSGSHTAPLDGVVTEDVLLGRKYIVIRYVQRCLSPVSLDGNLLRIMLVWYNSAIGDTEVRVTFTSPSVSSSVGWGNNSPTG